MCAHSETQGAATLSTRSWIDTLAVGASALCLAHCLLLPVAMASLPAIATIFETPAWAHGALLALALPLSFMALLGGYRHHGRWLPPAVGFLGLALMGAGVAFEDSRILETGLTVVGTTLVALAHIRNWRLRSVRRRSAQPASFGPSY